MKVLRMDQLEKDRVVECPRGGFVSYRPLLARDGMGFTMTKTCIPKGGHQHWYYKNHLEACYCVSGCGELIDARTNQKYVVVPDTVYVLDDHDPHYFIATTDVVLICVFNPPLVGKEVHQLDGSYEAAV